MGPRSIIAKLLVSAAILAVTTLMGAVAATTAGATRIDPGGTPRIAVSGLTGPSLLPAGTLLPGDTVTTTASVAYVGTGRASELGIEAVHFLSRSPASDPSCTAADPASKLTLTVRTAGSILFEGTMTEFARSHGSPDAMLALPGPWISGRAHAVTITVGLDRAADNAYMGCVSRADLNWLT